MSASNIFAVALVYSKAVTHQTVTWKLIHWRGGGCSADEALGKAIAANRVETDGYGLHLSSAIPFFDDANPAPEE